LLEYSTDNDILVIVNKRAGHFLVDSGSVFTIYSNKDLNEVNNLDSFFETGDMRTPHQDAEFAIHQIVEIATRALSPGINDPYTAITCIDNLSNIICKLTSIQYPYKNRYDDEGHLRLVIDTLDFEGMLDAAYNQIRQNAEANPTVLIRLLDALSCIMEFVQSSSQQKAVLKHIDMVMRIAEKKFTEKNDLTDLKIRYEKINIRYD
jgi:uncharacterized membrane protein